MPKIKLKPNSPEYADENAKSDVHPCEMPGCGLDGLHKAPKHRGLNEYYFFCTDHIREYNAAWDFFSGMNEDEVKDHMNKSIYGFRPTWRYDNHAGMEENIRAKAWDEFGAGGSSSSDGAYENNQQEHFGQQHHDSTVTEAMAVMGLAPPTTLDEIKTEYKKLAKKYHPDLNQGDKNAEEKLKGINMAYTVLKMAYVEFEKLPERS